MISLTLLAIQITFSSGYRTNRSSFPAWATAARVVFAMSPNSASCERVFSLLENMFGEQQMQALADQLRAALMLAYNKRRVGCRCVDQSDGSVCSILYFPYSTGKYSRKKRHLAAGMVFILEYRNCWLGKTYLTQ